MDPMPLITGVAEIVLSVADLPLMRAFYTEVLGFQLHSEVSLESEVPDPQGEPTITFLTIQEIDTPLGNGGHPQLLALIDYQRHVFAKRRFVGHDATRSTLNHLAFEIPPESFDAHARRLESLGLELKFSEFPTMNARAMFFQDPEANMLELVCRLSTRT